jgi:AbrB family looped-hinge helix DNA binding protein
MNMNVTVSAKGWVVIPAVLRKKYGIKPGARLQFVDYGGALELIPVPDNPVEAAAGMLKGGNSLTEALLAEHRRELENER